jgi:restriction system protein
MAIWLVRAGGHGEHENKFLEEGRIYLTWGRKICHDLSLFEDQKALYTFLPEACPDWKMGRIRTNSGQFWSFSHRMKSKDWIVMPSKFTATIHVGEITGDYTFVPKGPEPYFHYRKVKWIKTNIPRTNFDQDLLYSLGVPLTICQVKRNDAERRIRAMQPLNWQNSGITLDPTDITSDGTDETSSDSIDLEQIASDQIARLIISKFKGHDLERLVQAILDAQGLTTYHSPKGPDGGVDILAAPGLLGFDSPRILVQVKSQDSPLDRPALDQLVGTMQHVGADQGLLVCWGGFKRTVSAEEARLFFKVRLWDQAKLIEQLLKHYDNLDEDIKAELPLKRIWTVASVSDDD